MSSVESKRSNTISNPLDVIIVGGGLSGLTVAWNLSKEKKRWKLLEASSNIGGRLQNDIAGNDIDLGGAWVWPRQQHMENIIQSLELETFLQPGDSSSFRIVGGAEAIVKKILEKLQNGDHNMHCIETNSPVVACHRKSESLASVELASGRTLHAKHICIACPPKLVNIHIQFNPPLSSAKSRAMALSQTWMAGVTKVALVYRSLKFWPDYESNGGFYPSVNRPAFQMYDASPRDGSVCALTFFTLASLSDDGDDDSKLAKDCADQLCESLSERTIQNFPNIMKDVRGYDEYHVKRWPQEKYISEDENPDNIAPHPQPNAELAKSEWDGMLLFAGTETDLVSPGVMEGAVGSAMRATEELLKRL